MSPTAGAPAWHAAAIVAVVLAAYANAVGAGFAFDDAAAVLDNPLVRDPAAFLPGGGAYSAHPNRFVGNLSFALNRWLLGPGAAGFHLVNVGIHLANALLVRALVLLCFRAPRLAASRLGPSAGSVAFAAGLLFAAHPLQTQAVTYVAQRYASLATLFYVLSVVLYLRWRLSEQATGFSRARAAVGAGGTVAAALLAMRTKELAITLPVAVLLVEALLFEGRWRARLLRLAPVLATLPVIPLTLVNPLRPAAGLLQDVAAATAMQTSVSRLDYLRTQATVVAKYLGLLLLPVGQNVDHDVALRRTFDAPVAGGTLLLAALAVLALVLVLRVRRGVADSAWLLAALGIGWFFVTLSVESSVLPIVDLMFEHRVYLPSAGFFLLCAVAAAALAQRLAPARAPRAVAAAGLVLALPLAAATHARNRVWHDEIALWTDAVAKSPDKARARYNLATALVEARRESEAVEHFQADVRIDPGHLEGWTNLGAALEASGRPAEAAAALRTALRLKPDDALAHYNLGRLLLVQGLAEEAEQAFARTLAALPAHVGAWANRAAALNRQRRFAETVALWREAPPAVRENGEAVFNYGVACVAAGDAAGAEQAVGRLDALDSALAARLRSYRAGVLQGR